MRVILRMAEGDLAFTAGDFSSCDGAHFALFGVAGENPARWSQEPDHEPIGGSDAIAQVTFGPGTDAERALTVEAR